jgi:hypothetical protein
MKRDYPNKDKKKNKSYHPVVPRDTRRFYWKEDRLKEKEALRKIVEEGKDEGDVNLPGQHRHSAKWDCA